MSYKPKKHEVQLITAGLTEAQEQMKRLGAWTPPKPSELPLEKRLGQNWDAAYIERVRAIEQKLGRAICGSKPKMSASRKRKATTEPCRNRPSKDNPRCNFCGAKLARAHRSGQFTFGYRMSQNTWEMRAGVADPLFKSMPKTMEQAYEYYKEAERPTELTGALALAQAKVAELLAVQKDGEQGLADQWEALQVLVKQGQALRKNSKATAEEWSNLFLTIEAAVMDRSQMAAHSEEMRYWVEQQRKLAETEEKRRRHARDFVSREAVKHLMASIYLAVEEVLKKELDPGLVGEALTKHFGGVPSKTLLDTVKGKMTRLLHNAVRAGARDAVKRLGPSSAEG